jgi:hypothetical protein
MLAGRCASGQAVLRQRAKPALVTDRPPWSRPMIAPPQPSEPDQRRREQCQSCREQCQRRRLGHRAKASKIQGGNLGRDDIRRTGGVAWVAEGRHRIGYIRGGDIYGVAAIGPADVEKRVWVARRIDNGAARYRPKNTVEVEAGHQPWIEYLVADEVVPDRDVAAGCVPGAEAVNTGSLAKSSRGRPGTAGCTGSRARYPRTGCSRRPSLRAASWDRHHRRQRAWLAGRS